MTEKETLNFLTTNLSGPASLGDPETVRKPTLREAYEVYYKALMPHHKAQLYFVEKLADFAETLRSIGKASLYSDEEWIDFIRSSGRSWDEARDLWDAYVCQPEG
jgi:hypothetical protein